MDEQHAPDCGYYARDGCSCEGSRDYLLARIKELEEERDMLHRQIRAWVQSGKDFIQGAERAAERALAGKGATEESPFVCERPGCRIERPHRHGTQRSC